MVNPNLRLRSLLPITLLILFSTVACQPPSTTDGTETADTSAPTTEVEDADESDTEEAEDDSDDGAAPAEDVVLGISKDGIRAITPDGSITNIEFGTDIETAEGVVTAILGEPQETFENGECPAGPLTGTTWPNGFSIQAQDGQFVGWGGVREDFESASLTTVQGIGIGSTVTELEEAYEVEIFESTLGIEFLADQLSGILSSDAPEGTITNLWAGTNCIFR